jgi:hypothetical protein
MLSVTAARMSAFNAFIDLVALMGALDKVSFTTTAYPTLAPRDSRPHDYALN